VKTLFRLVVLVLMLGGWALAAASLYVIRTPEKISIIPRDKVDFMTIHEVFVDTRGWQVEDASSHPAVVKRMLDRDKVALLQHLAPQASERELTRLLSDAVERGEANLRNEAKSTTSPVKASRETKPKGKPHLQGEARRVDRGEKAEAKSRPEDKSDGLAGHPWLSLARSLDFD
jgi:hypothetical protein